MVGELRKKSLIYTVAGTKHTHIRKKEEKEKEEKYTCY